MAQTSLKFDSCSYEEKLRRSVGPGMYAVATPANDCHGCAKDIPADPYLRYQAWGPGFCAPGAAVDDESEVRGLNYKASKCTTDSYLPGKWAPKGVCTPAGSAANPGCLRPTEPTRLSNPPCTLRATGWNRWEWLCYNPQDHAIRPFDWFTPYRTVVKDNHVPCLATPLDESDFVPRAGPHPSMDQQTVPFVPPTGCGAEPPGDPFSPIMNSCKTLGRPSP